MYIENPNYFGHMTFDYRDFMLKSCVLLSYKFLNQGTPPLYILPATHDIFTYIFLAPPTFSIKIEEKIKRGEG